MVKKHKKIFFKIQNNYLEIYKKNRPKFMANGGKGHTHLRPGP